MRPEQIREAERLLGCLDGVNEIAAFEAPKYANSGLSLRVSIYDGDEDGGEYHADVLLPLSMLDLIIPELRGALRAKLNHMGVKLPNEHEP